MPGSRSTFAGVACIPRRNIRLSKASSRLMIAFFAPSVCRTSTYRPRMVVPTSSALTGPNIGFKCSFQRDRASSKDLRPLMRYSRSTSSHHGEHGGTSGLDLGDMPASKRIAGVSGRARARRYAQPGNEGGRRSLRQTKDRSARKSR